MLYLIGGENTYLSTNRLKELEDEFVKAKSGEIKIIDAQEVGSASDILQETESLSLFEKPTLYIIKRMLHAPQAISDPFLAYLEKATNISIVLWEDSSFDKRKKLYKFVSKHGVVEDFTHLSSTQLKSWVQKYLQNKVSYDAGCIEAIILKAGDNQMFLSSLLDNLILLVEAQGKKTLTREDIDSFVEKTTEENVWEFVDALGNQNKATALLIVEELLQERGDFPKILGLVARQFRIITLTKHLMAQNASSNEIARVLKLHPFVVKKATQQCRNFSLEQLHKLYNKLVRTDLAIKEGRFEEKLALDLFIAAT